MRCPKGEQNREPQIPRMVQARQTVSSQRPKDGIRQRRVQCSEKDRKLDCVYRVHILHRNLGQHEQGGQRGKTDVPFAFVTGQVAR
jgi:hypothetical protein